MQSKIITITALAFIFCTHSKADQVTLTNGDRVSGEIVRSDLTTMTLNTEFLGEVAIRWAAISEITSEQELFVTDVNGQVFVGRVSTRGGTIQVQTPQAGTVPVNKVAIATIRSRGQQDAYEAEIERLRNPGLLDFWSGYIDGGFSFSGGNAETSAISTSMRTERSTPRDKISVYTTTLFAQNSTSGVSETTANAIRGGTRYDVNLSDRLFTFGFIDLEFDEFQNLDLRNVFGGGLGWHVQRTDRTVFDVFSGGSFNQEFFENDLTRKSGEIVLGEELTYRLAETTALSERLVFYPNLSNTGEYRLQFDSSLTSELLNWLAWHLTLSDRFLSNPTPGVKKNDVLITTGIRFNFGEGLR
jgi:putative salt-induced outer membrane protein YdiY